MKNSSKKSNVFYVVVSVIVSLLLMAVILILKQGQSAINTMFWISFILIGYVALSAIPPSNFMGCVNPSPKGPGNGYTMVTSANSNATKQPSQRTHFKSGMLHIGPLQKFAFIIGMILIIVSTMATYIPGFRAFFLS